MVADDQVLLISDSDPGVPGSHWWVTPGGGVDGGEPVAEAAARELYEETGLRLPPEGLGDPVARRVAIHGYSDRILIQAETFFRVEVSPFEPAPTHLTATELKRMTGYGWFGLGELPQPLWPGELAQLASTDDQIELGVVEESTVPVTERERAKVDAYLEDLERTRK